MVWLTRVRDSSSAAKRFVREGPVYDVVFSPTVPSVYFLTIEN